MIFLSKSEIDYWDKQMLTAEGAPSRIALYLMQPAREPAMPRDPDHYPIRCVADVMSTGT